MTARMVGHFSAIVCLLLLFQFNLAEQQCYSFGGGHVYPQETSTASGHTLQWTKAMSTSATLEHPIKSTFEDYNTLGHINMYFDF